MIDTVVKIECDWCGKLNEASKKMVDFNGKKIRMGEKTLRKNSEKRGWISLVHGNGIIEDFCGKECYELYKQEQSKH